MTTFISALRNGAKLLERRDDDGFDRLSNRYSVGILIMMAVFISTKSYVGDPIDCYAPKEFTSQWIKYTDNYCWISNTYYVPLTQDLTPTIPPGGLTPGEKSIYAQELSYYQWVPIILTFCAALFAVPAQIWAWASNTGGYDVEAMVKATKGTSSLNPETRDKTVQYLVNQMDRVLGYRRPLNGRRVGVGKNFGHFLFFAYLIVKVLYIANAIGMIFLLEAMLGDGYSAYGTEQLKALQNPDYSGSVRFPYVTFCDFWVRRLGGNMQRYTVQCVLPVNLFNEKVFVVLWFWLVFLAAASVLGFVLWLFTALNSVNRTFVRKYLTIMGRLQKDDYNQDDINEFMNGYLRLDGVFCMRLILKNTNDAIGGEIMAALWDQWLQTRKPRYEPTTDNLLPGRQADEAV
ncbi:innexin unc-9-like [Watersipora subatra]|uniref:innexin unc-9-like n=1 Tax=Watersipora subatra TaxID=2589382 RepID=UPI00355B90A4